MYYYENIGASFDYGRRDYRDDKPRVHYSGWQKFAMFMAWLPLVIYLFVLMINVVSNMPERETIPYDPVYYQELCDIRNVAMKEANNRIDNNTMTPEACAGFVHEIITAEYNMRKMNKVPSMLMTSTYFIHVYFESVAWKDNGKAIHDRYIKEFDRLEGREPSKPIDFNLWELLSSLSILLSLIFIGNLAVIIVKRFPRSIWQEPNVTAGDVISIFIYETIPFLGAAKYQEDNWLKKIADDAVESFLRKYGNKKHQKLMAYIYAAFVVMNVLFVTVIVVSSHAIYFYFGADWTSKALINFLRWYLTLFKPLRTATTELVSCNGINAPPMLVCGSN